MTSTSSVKSYFGKSYNFPLYAVPSPSYQREKMTREKDIWASLAEPHEVWIVIMQMWPCGSTAVIDLRAAKHQYTGALRDLFNGEIMGEITGKSGQMQQQLIKTKAVIQSRREMHLQNLTC